MKKLIIISIIILAFSCTATEPVVVEVKPIVKPEVSLSLINAIDSADMYKYSK